PHQIGRFASRARYLAANGWNPLTRSAWLIDIRKGSPDGSLVNARFLPRAKFFSHLAAFDVQADWLAELDPQFIYSLPSNLEGLLAVFADGKRKLFSLKRIFTGGEILEESVRKDARRYLNAEIADNYGSTEAFLAWQCPAGSYHVNAEHVIVEIVDENGKQVCAGSAGRVLVTTLENRLMPLIRYDLGDYAIASDARCSCGRTLPLIGKILGRGVNLFRLPGGGLISPWQLIDTMKAMPAVRQVQIEQRSLNQYIVRYAAESALTPNIEEDVRTGFRTTMGQAAQVHFDYVEEIPRGAGGKFMAALSALSAADTK
ncbi:MAG TPA: AMP-binding protein, partial [Candidatus Binataceae bacterium]|nr:AMP-binding protein [Candidatus Binataceae bacterium]